MSEATDRELLPLRERLSDWTEWDEAAFCLGRLIGLLPESYSFGSAKGLLATNYRPGA